CAPARPSAAGRARPAGAPLRPPPPGSGPAAPLRAAKQPGARQRPGFRPRTRFDDTRPLRDADARWATVAPRTPPVTRGAPPPSSCPLPGASPAPRHAGEEADNIASLTHLGPSPGLHRIPRQHPLDDPDLR